MKNKVIIILLICTIFHIYTFAQVVDYGVGEANNKFILSSGVLGGRTDYDYLSLKNHPDVSGVPLGGIGAGNVNFSPSGQFTRIGINNIHTPIKRSRGSFFALWTKQGEQVKAIRLVRDNDNYLGMPGVSNTSYTGLFPTATLRAEDNSLVVIPTIKASSSLTPHNTKDSSLPFVWLDVELLANEATEVSVAFSWEDILGLYNDPKSLDGIDDGQLLTTQGKVKKVSVDFWPIKDKSATNAVPYQTKKVNGIMQLVQNPLTPLKYTHQNYVDRVVLLCENANGQQVTYLPVYDIGNGTERWNSFIQNGSFADSFTASELTKQAAKSNASAIAVKVKMGKGERKTIRFALAWWAPEITIDESTAKVGSYWPNGSDYNKYYHNYFKSLDELVAYCLSNKARLQKETTSWHEPVMKSSLPDWYKFKLINSGYVAYTNIILTKGGEMTVNEGAMGGLAGTMDQRLSSHPFYQKFFTQMDRSEMDIFADAKDPDENYILHFIGHYYVGMGKVGGNVPTMKGHMLDNSSGWLIQLVKDYEQTGDIEYLKSHADMVKKIMVFLRAAMPEGSQVPVGLTTYDDFPHPPLYAYYAGVWLTTLKAYEVFGQAMGDQAVVEDARIQFTVSQCEIVKKLWNGRFFAYGAESDGSKRLDCILFTGQLAGQFLSRYCGWGDIFPMDIVKAATVSQFKISLSKTPDYYANKVWDINLGRGIDKRGSQCWPFYLESYTALMAMQAGFYQDAMDVMKHIQLVHLRQGWTWTQNLWNPRDITYMTAPVTWFSTDVLAGAGLNVPREELRLAPIIEGNETVILPLFYPTFWATLTADPTTKKLTFAVTKTFGNKPVKISTIISEPAGRPTSERKEIAITPFICEQGKTLDLSAKWSDIVNSAIEPSLLSNPDAHEFRYVNKPRL